MTCTLCKHENSEKLSVRSMHITVNENILFTTYGKWPCRSIEVWHSRQPLWPTPCILTLCSLIVYMLSAVEVEGFDVTTDETFLVPSAVVEIFSFFTKGGCNTARGTGGGFAISSPLSSGLKYITFPGWQRHYHFTRRNSEIEWNGPLKSNLLEFAGLPLWAPSFKWVRNSASPKNIRQQCGHFFPFRIWWVYINKENLCNNLIHIHAPQDKVRNRNEQTKIICQTANLNMNCNLFKAVVWFRRQHLHTNWAQHRISSFMTLENYNHRYNPKPELESLYFMAKAVTWL